MEISTRRTFFGKIGAMAAVVAGVPKVFAQSSSPVGAGMPSGVPGSDKHPHGGSNNHVHNGIYYFSGTGSNDGYPQDDHVLVTDPFEKHVVRTMDALKKSLERKGCMHHG